MQLFCALFRAGLLKVKTKSLSPPSTYFRYVSDEALELYIFFGKLGLTLPNLAQNPASMVIWKQFKRKMKKKWKKKLTCLTRKI
jgi:hypothetical protein